MPSARPRSQTPLVLAAIALGVIVGALWPRAGQAMKPVGEAFINLIRMTTAPIVFCTVVLGIGQMGSVRRVGRVGGKALLYFEVVTTFALVIGVAVAGVVRPGAGVDTSAIGRSPDVVGYATAARELRVTTFLSHLVPQHIVDAFARGDILQVLLFAVLFGVAVTRLGDRGRPLLRGIDLVCKALFGVLELVMRLAPVGAFGGMAFTVGSYGIGTLLPLLRLLIALYLTMALFVLGVLGLVCRAYGFRITRLLGFIREELLIVLGTSSSESVLPRVMEKLETLGCSRSVVGLVVPTGYSFNLDGTTIYLSMAVLFLAQAFKLQLGLGEQLSLIAVLMVTSKGAAAVTGGGFVVLASTLSATHLLPVEGLALLIGVDRFMSEARALVNLIGNCVATLVISRSEAELDAVRYAAALEPPVRAIG
jgi:aerobic C4-dicarboxylate transport protein